jgi:hypothetical protein
MSRTFFALLIVFIGFSGCASTELSQVGSMSPERAINTPEQAARLEKEHG